MVIFEKIGYIWRSQGILCQGASLVFNWYSMGSAFLGGKLTFDTKL